VFCGGLISEQWAVYIQTRPNSTPLLSEPSTTLKKNNGVEKLSKQAWNRALANKLNIPNRTFPAGKDIIPVFVYLRLSPTNIEGQNKGGTRTFTSQENRIIHWNKTLKPMGYQVVNQFVEVVSGQDANRPEYRKMMNAFKAGGAKVIVAASMFRFARNLEELIKAIKIIKENNGELILLKNNLTINNEDNPIQDLIVHMFGAVGEFQAKLASQQVQEKVQILRQNPFWWTGQKPKIVGEKLTDLIDMYYSKKARTVGGIDGHKGDRLSKTETVFQYTIQDIADHFGMSKGSVSEMVSKYVTCGVMTNRSPKMARKVETPNWLDLPAYVKPKNAKKGSHSILHPHYWPENVKSEVAKKFGDYKKIAKNGNHEVTVQAWKFGKKIYFGWLKSYVKATQENAEIFAHHKDLMSGGDYKLGARSKMAMSKDEIKDLTHHELADRADQ